MNCRAVLKSYTFIWNLYAFFFFLYFIFLEKQQVNLHKIHSDEAKRPSGLVHRITALRFGMGR